MSKFIRINTTYVNEEPRAETYYVRKREIRYVKATVNSHGDEYTDIMLKDLTLLTIGPAERGQTLEFVCGGLGDPIVDEFGTGICSYHDRPNTEFGRARDKKIMALNDKRTVDNIKAIQRDKSKDN